MTRDGRELRLFFNGRNVDNRNRVDPIGAAGYPTSPLIEAAGYAALDAVLRRHGRAPPASATPPPSLR